MGLLDALSGAALSGLLQRTYIMKSPTSSFLGLNIPQVLAVFDAVLEENPEYTADVTQHPVESGPEITDHIQLKNATLSIKGTISNSPLDLAGSVANVASAGIGLLTSSQARNNLLDTGLQQVGSIAGAGLLAGGGVSANAFTGGAADSVARTILLTAYQNKQLIDVVTKRQKYKTMAIQSLKFPRDSQTGYQVVFELECIQVRIVSPISLLFNQLSQDVITAASQPTNLGAQTGNAVTEQAASSAGNNSLLRKGLGL